LLIDRFADGDSSNNQPLRGVVYPEVDWHGGDLMGATAVLNSGYFDRLGVKAIWLSPVNAQTNGDFGDRALESRRIAAYHGYWPIKARMVEPRFGSDQALRDFVQAAHAKGVRVLLDLINNQVHEQHEYYQNHPDWFRTNCICGTNGCGWSEKPLECLFASYLPDINWRNPEAEKQFIADALAWVEDFDVDGFRVDAVKHVESSAIFNLRFALDQKFGGGERIVMIGETAVGQNDQWQDGCGESFQNGYAWINGYIGQNALDGQFDFPTHHQIRWQLLSGYGQYPNVENALQMASSQYDDQSLMVQFIGSHDTSRVISEAENQSNFGCAWPSECQAVGLVQNLDVIKRLWRAWIVLYTQTAMPLLYYGDEIAMPGSTDPDNRRDMVFDGVLANLTPAFDQRFPTQLNDLQLKQRAFLETLGQIRQNHREMIKKSHYHRWLIDSDVWVYGFEMGQQRLIIALNQGQQNRNIQFALSTPFNRAQDLFSSFAMVHDRSLIGQSNLQIQNQQVSLDLSVGGMGIWLVE
jgi:glycosidase